MASKKELNKAYYEQHKKEIAEQRRIKRSEEKELITQAKAQTQAPQTQAPQTQAPHISGSYQTDKVRVLPIDVSAYLKTVTEKYLDNNGNLDRIERQFSKSLEKYILAFSGESGIGKTLSIKYYA